KLRGHLQVGIGRDVEMTDTLIVLDDGYARSFGDEADEPRSAARDAEIDLVLELEQLVEQRAIRRHELHRLVLEAVHQRGVGLQRLASSAQERGVSAAQA